MHGIAYRAASAVNMGMPPSLNPDARLPKRQRYVARAPVQAHGRAVGVASIIGDAGVETPLVKTDHHVQAFADVPGGADPGIVVVILPDRLRQTGQAVITCRSGKGPVPNTRIGITKGSRLVCRRDEKAITRRYAAVVL